MMWQCAFHNPSRAHTHTFIKSCLVPFFSNHPLEAYIATPHSYVRVCPLRIDPFRHNVHILF